ncbi:DUF397 domain-containing protein [Streptomyces roseirectus]|uniref:DUF397 domain-containing protein n=1 Tax=Streptomyces roseirectus TaxID=2768066 RepID=A0A7H0ITP2_9ACTN|nr:DUF397 domain-containing protein [Streptomyces roseirectus]QNP76158.1 DUF397 domain-containing protein [Streptomyces roseirectus]
MTAPEWAWLRSTCSDQSSGNCLEIAALSGHTDLRGSKVEHGPAILVDSPAFAAFVQGLTI